MGDTYQLRRNDDVDRQVERIRDYLTELKAKPSDADCLRWALKKGEEYLQGKPKPRSPRRDPLEYHGVIRTKY